MSMFVQHNIVNKGKYSQNNEDAFIVDHFKGFTGTFIDIGANDGKTFSNTRALAELGWRGVLVEPSPKAFAELEKNYEGLRGFYMYNVAISNHNGNAILHESGALINDKDVALVSTLHAKEMDRFKSVVSYDPITVKCYKWKTFLNRLKFKHFDFISLDVEGEELNILPDMDLSQTKCICIEWNGNEILKKTYEVYIKGFKLIYTSAENLLYAR